MRAGSSVALLIAALAGACADPQALSVEPRALAFGGVVLGESAARTVTVEQPSGARAAFSIAVYPSDVGFRVEGLVPAVIEPGERWTFDVTFAPLAEGAADAVLAVASENVLGGVHLDVVLSGDGLAGPRDGDRDGFPAGEDCDDDDASVWPGAEEICDGKDGDCDGVTPEDEIDDDGDGVHLCAGDCDDDDASVFPGADEFCDGVDVDCGVEPELDADLDGVRSCAGDCDDADPSVHPGAEEGCDGLDTDCVDGPAAGEIDADLDGFAPCAGDCNDWDVAVFPGQTEACNGLDDDCDTDVPADEADVDGDGVRACTDCADENPDIYPGAAELCDGLDGDCDGAVPQDEVDGDLDTFAPCALDCDDTAPTRYPAAPELCNGLDDDCDNVVPADEFDGDGDLALACADCDDADATRYPGAAELCDGLDGDCDTVVPDDELDGDGDTVIACADCDDGEATVYPGAGEICDRLDNDCSGTVPADEQDGEGDGMAPCEGDCDDTDADTYDGAAEECFDAVDNDCDTVVNGQCDCPIWATPTAGACVDGTWACPFGGVQAAVDAGAASGCDTIWLQDGVFAGPVSIPANLTIEGWGGADAASIAGGTPVISAIGHALTLRDVTVSGGSGAEGGGLHGENTTITIDAVVFDGNVCDAGGRGAGLYCENCSLDVLDSTFVDNACGYGGSDSGNEGGAIYVTGGDVLVQGSTFLGNEAGDGSAIYSVTGSLPHWFIQDEFYANFAADTFGWFEIEGGAVVLDGNYNVVANCIFADNNAQSGGAGVSFGAQGSSAGVLNSVFVWNWSNQGAGIWFQSQYSRTAIVWNNVIAWNTGYGVYAEGAIPSNVQYNDLHQNSAGAFGSGLPIFGVPANNVTFAPGFVGVNDDGNYANDDYHLAAGSQCVDAGNPSAYWLDPDGGRADIGLYGGPWGSWP
jgi:hypothetical protein